MTMNKANLKVRAYTIFIGLFGVFVVVAFFDRASRLSLLIVAFSFLGFGWLVERFLSHKAALSVRKRGTEMHGLGSFEIDGELTISDQIDLSGGQILAGLPRGFYSVCVEIWFDGEDSYVSGITISGPTAWQSPRPQEINLAVDTGFLIFAGTKRSEDLLLCVQEAQSKILCSENRVVDAEVLILGERNVGIVTSTGYGDGQYSIKIGLRENNRPEIVCRFVDEE